MRAISQEKSAELCAFYTSGLKLEETAARGGVCIETVRKALKSNGVAARHRGKRKGQGIVAGIDDAALSEFKRKWDALDSTVKGTISENYVKTRLAEKGFDVWEPATQNHRTDLIILVGQRVVRLQVKTATYDLATKCFRANFSRRRRGKAATNYDGADVDFFVVYCAGLQPVRLYIVPAGAVKNRSPRLFPNRDRLLSIEGKAPLERFLDAFELLA